MARARLTEVELEYDLLGDATKPTIVLISGMSSQLIAWEDDFCLALAGRGFQILRFDNRDVGLSSDLSHLGTPDIDAVAAGAAEPPYTLDDMARDTAELLDALGISSAHVVGASMGGYVAQLVAINHAEKVLSLTSLMSGLGGADTVHNSSGPAIVPPVPEAGREELIEQMVMVGRYCSGIFFDEERIRGLVTAAMDRSLRPGARLRQLAATVAAPSRAEALGRIGVPVLVIHGEDDPLLPFENGLRTAAAVPGSTFVGIPGVGHELPPQIWPTLVEAIAEHASVARGAST